MFAVGRSHVIGHPCVELAGNQPIGDRDLACILSRCHVEEPGGGDGTGVAEAVAELGSAHHNS